MSLGLLKSGLRGTVNTEAVGGAEVLSGRAFTQHAKTRGSTPNVKKQEDEEGKDGGGKRWRLSFALCLRSVLTLGEQR